MDVAHTQDGSVQSSADVLAHVRVNGAPLQELPSDLYIPPDALEVFLDEFTGPLDLLLYLIRRSNFNILDIPMTQLTAQYLAYIDMMEYNQLELAAEYLLMAAMLIEIKSRLLLPKSEMANEDDGLDPRAELVRRLLEYEQMKQAAFQMTTLEQVDRDFYWTALTAEKIAPPPPAITLSELQLAWQALMQRATWYAHHTITREELSVREYMGRILLCLQEESTLLFVNLFKETRSRALLVVNFLAILELAREQLIDITQAESFSLIYVSLKIGEA